MHAVMRSLCRGPRVRSGVPGAMPLGCPTAAVDWSARAQLRTLLPRRRLCALPRGQLARGGTACRRGNGIALIVPRCTLVASFPPALQALRARYPDVTGRKSLLDEYEETYGGPTGVLGFPASGAALDSTLRRLREHFFGVVLSFPLLSA